MGAHRFAGTGFADHAEDLAGGEIERDAIDGVGPFAAGGQRDLEVLDRDGGSSDMLSVRPCEARVERVVEAFADQVERRAPRSGWRCRETP